MTWRLQPRTGRLADFFGPTPKGDRPISNISYVSDCVFPNINELVRSSNRIPEVIAKVIDLVTRLLDSEMGGVMLYNQETNELVLQKPAFHMTNDELIAAYRVPLDNGHNTANVYITGEPYISNDSLSDSRLRQKFVKLFGARNVITVPLEIDNRRIGVVHVSNKRNGKFTNEDLEVLTFLASHLVIFIENAIIYERERKQAEELAVLNSRLKRLFEIHTNLIQQVLNEDGMSLMVKTLADLLNAHVFVEDKHFNLIVSSHPDVGDFSTGDLLQEQDKMHMLDKGQTVKSAPYMHDDQQVTRFISPIGGAQYTMGYLSMVIEAETEPSNVKMLAFEQGAMALALEMMKGRIKFEMESRFRSEFLDDLFSGKQNDIEKIIQRASFFQYDLGKESRVFMVSLDEDEGAGKEHSEIQNYDLYERFYHLVISVVQKSFPGSLAIGKRNYVEVLLPVDLNLIQEKLKQRLVEFREQLTVHCPEGRILIGVGSECRYFEDYHRSYQQARKALEIGCFITRQNGVIFYDQLGIYSLLFEINDLSLLKKLVVNKLGPLLEYDDKKNSNLTYTLEVYLETGGSLKETAQILFIHVTTLKYRLGRIQEFLKLDLRKTENHFDLQLALFAHRFLARN